MNAIERLYMVVTWVPDGKDEARAALADLEALVQAAETCFAAVESGNVYWVADDDRINALAAAVARVKGDTT